MLKIQTKKTDNYENPKQHQSKLFINKIQYR